MRFLVAIRSSTYSEPTLQIGSAIANAFSADLSVVYVGDRPKELLSGGVHLARDALLNWEINHPGVDVLRWAYRRLQEWKFLDPALEQFDPTNLVQDTDRVRVILPHLHGEKIRLIFREGDPVDQLRKETEFRDYILTIVGGGSRKRLTRQLVQFVDTSILFVKNFDPDWNYKLLLCVDDSQATKRAVVFGTRVAQHFKAPVDLLTVSKTQRFGKGYRGAAQWAQRYMDRMQIPYEQHFKTGDPATVFAESAGTDHIIIMGKSKMNPLKAFFKGTKPGDTVLRAYGPVILVR
ncbi:MAG: universal stress protein [Fidelibacterota bacterium]|nr:MAG: universal stress protein [Candidatus Neomarinimicrobiota bacterium]